MYLGEALTSWWFWLIVLPAAVLWGRWEKREEEKRGRPFTRGERLKRDLGMRLLWVIGGVTVGLVVWFMDR